MPVNSVNLEKIQTLLHGLCLNMSLHIQPIKMKNLFTYLLGISSILYACESPKKNTNTDTDNHQDAGKLLPDSSNMLEKNGIRLSLVTSLPEFPGAKLTQSSPEPNQKLQPGNTYFIYEVFNFELGRQTDTGACGNCSNSEEGQHIHFILNNEPYVALYSPKHTQELKEGSYVELSFLSRSYHISIKQPDAYVLRKITVGKANDLDKTDLNAPHMFYSRPKGEYTGSGADKIVLDFYLVNADLSLDGNKVVATIDSSEFIIDKWAAYLIEGLEDGEHSIKLEFVDKDNKRIESPFNPVTRTIQVARKTKS